MKKVLKAIIFVIATICVSPLIILANIGKTVFNSFTLFVFGSQCLSIVPGVVGNFFRTAYYRFTLAEFHFDSFMLFGTIMPNPGTRMGNNCKIGGYAIIGLADIGKGVGISSKVSIIAGRYQHNFTDLNKSVFDTEPVYERIYIGDEVFIGEGAVVMANIGEYSIVGAGAVVVKDIPPYSVAVGNPARVIKNRRAELKQSS